MSSTEITKTVGLLLIFLLAQVKCHPYHVAGKCDHKNDGLDPECCAQIKSWVHVKTIVRGTGCKWYRLTLIGNADQDQDVRCPDNQLFNTKSCRCDVPDNVRCRDLGHPEELPVARTFINCMTKCLEQKEELITKLYEKCSTLPSCWMTQNNLPGLTCAGTCDKKAKPFPLPTPACKRTVDGKGPLCCERVFLDMPVEEVVINRFTPVLGTRCKQYHHQAIGTISGTRFLTQECPHGQLFNADQDKCYCDDAQNVNKLCRLGDTKPPKK